MSRAAVRDNSNAFSLFPFLAVLLCTMGALLVVLVAVTRLSRDQAREQASRKRTEAASQPAPTIDRRTQLEHVERYVARLEQVQVEAERQLRDDQLHLRDLEDHMRRLQNQAASLGAAAAELDALQQEHHDDREQAQREAARLERLIADTRESIEELKREVASRPRSYAVVPYKGPHGTHRPPLYIECRKDAVILQPEGIRLTKYDFRPPLGPGNPLAAALRAARAHFVSRYPDAEIGSEHDPYPLILIRPDGIAAYYVVRKAIESWDSDFGYEVVDGDWDLAFPPADPELATAESQAIELARLRMRMLAEAAPRAYGTVDSGGRGVFPSSPSSASGLASQEFEGGTGGGYGFGRPEGASLTGNGLTDGEPGGRDGFGQPDDGLGLDGDGSANGMAGGEGLAGDLSAAHDGSSGSGAGLGEFVDGNSHGPDDAATPGANGGGEKGAGSSAADPGALVAGGGSGDGATGSGQPAPSGVAGSQSTGAAGSSAGALAGGAATGGAAAGTAGAAAGAAGSTACSGGANSSQAGSNQSTSNTLSMSVPAATQQDTHVSVSRSPSLDEPRGGPDSVPIRRSIHLIVRADRVAILPERSTTSDPLTGGKEIQLSGRTEAALDQVVSALKDHVEQWGIAGRGLFWRPVLVLDVGPDGQQRAEELVRLLKRRGIELRWATTAKRDVENNSNATRQQ